MSQSPIHRQMFIADLEGLVMPALLLNQFRLYYDSGDAKNAPKPIGVVFWAEVDADVAGRLAQGVSKLRPQDWTSGSRVSETERQLWIVEAIVPFGAAETIIAEIKSKLFPSRLLHVPVTTPAGTEVRVV